MTPKDLIITKDSEWVRIEGDEATVGITDYAQKMLGDITFIELPRVDKQVAQHEELAVVESVKAASDVYAPLAGTVAEVNQALDSAPELINQDPYGAGWICRLKNVDLAGRTGLMSAAQYDAMVAEKP